MKKRAFILFCLLPFSLGIVMGFPHGKKISFSGLSRGFNTGNIYPNDRITLSENGDIFQITQTSSQQITHGKHLIEPIFTGKDFFAITKTTNYASLDRYNLTGDFTNSLFTGNTGAVDTMHWISDPAIDQTDTQLAYVSDRDSEQMGLSDNALYLQSLTDNTLKMIAKPDPHSGGTTHPVFNPINSNVIFYDYYQYDGQSLTPYSTIRAYDQTTDNTTALTNEQLNAYQEDISPDGTHIIFLGRNDDNTVTIYLGTITDMQIVNTTKLLTGDYAYPTFSHNVGSIYFLQAEKNEGYNLMSAQIIHGHVTNIRAITTDSQLQGNSSYMVTTK